MRKPWMLLLVLALIGLTVVPLSCVKANFIFPVQTAAPDSAKITLLIASPTEGASYSDGTINVRFNETIEGPNGVNTTLSIVSTYQGDWMQDTRWSHFPPYDPHENWHHFLQYDFNVTGIPVGEHWLNITARGQGYYIINGTNYEFLLEKTVMVKFFMGAYPVITFLQNITSSTNSSFPLNFTVDRPVVNMTYCLGKEGVPLSGNTTLTGLSIGQHNVTVYASDVFSNTGSSGTLYFDIIGPKTQWVIVAASVITIGAVVAAALGVLLLRRRHRKEEGKTL